MLAFGAEATSAIAALQGRMPSPPSPPPPGPPTPNPGPLPLNVPIIQLDQGGKLPEIHRTKPGPTPDALYTSEPFTLDVPFDGVGLNLLPGIQSFVLIPGWVKLLSWVATSRETGSLQMDIWRVALRDLLTGHVPTSADSITGGNYVTITAGTSAQSTSLTGWSINLSQNDMLIYNVVSCVSIIKGNIILFGQRRNLG